MLPDLTLTFNSILYYLLANICRTITKELQKSNVTKQELKLAKKKCVVRISAYVMGVSVLFVRRIDQWSRDKSDKIVSVQVNRHETSWYFSFINSRKIHMQGGKGMLII